MKNTLIIFKDNKSYYFDRINYPDLSIQGLFKEKYSLKSEPLRMLRNLRSGLTRFYYQDWFKNISKYERIIVLDTSFKFDIKLLQNISRKAPDAEKYLYSWNIVRDESLFSIAKSEAAKAGFEYYSYDKGNCEKYGLKFNTIMYDKTLKPEKSELIYDTMFLGFLKDRKDEIIKLSNLFLSAGLNPRFVIVRHGESNEALPFEFHDNYISYYDYLKMVSSSRAIVDIAQEGQDGYSMRVMEAIFLNKKLITTNAAVRQSIFYSENNILILEPKKTDPDTIKAFFEKPFIDYDESVREYYSIEAWADRFKP